MGLSTKKLTRMRAQVAELLPQSATIQRLTHTSDGMGGITTAVTTVATGVACRLDPVSQALVVGIIGAQETIAVRYRLTMPWDAALAADCQVVVDGRTYQVLQVDADQSWRTAVRAIVSEVS